MRCAYQLCSNCNLNVMIEVCPRVVLLYCPLMNRNDKQQMRVSCSLVGFPRDTSYDLRFTHELRFTGRRTRANHQNGRGPLLLSSISQFTLQRLLLVVFKFTNFINFSFINSPTLKTHPKPLKARQTRNNANLN